MPADKKTCFGLDRTLLICLLYWAVDGDKQHFIATLLGLIIHDFIVFMVKLLLQDVYSLLVIQLNNLKFRSFNQSGINLKIKEGNYNSLIERSEVELCKITKKDQEQGEEGKQQRVPCENCKLLHEQETIKAKGKYKEKYKKRLLQKKENFEKIKSSLKDKYNEDRDKWDQERTLLKKKSEEMRWT